MKIKTIFRLLVLIVSSVAIFSLKTFSNDSDFTGKWQGNMCSTMIYVLENNRDAESNCSMQAIDFIQNGENIHGIKYVSDDKMSVIIQGKIYVDLFSAVQKSHLSIAGKSYDSMCFINGLISGNKITGRYSCPHDDSLDNPITEGVFTLYKQED